MQRWIYKSSSILLSTIGMDKPAAINLVHDFHGNLISRWPPPRAHVLRGLYRSTVRIVSFQGAMSLSGVRVDVLELLEYMISPPPHLILPGTMYLSRKAFFNMKHWSRINTSRLFTPITCCTREPYDPEWLAY